MTISTCRIEGLYKVEPEILEDSRGSFHEAFRRDKIFEGTGFVFDVAQINSSLSSKGVIRGVHFKKYPPGQAKFVSVTRGSVIDVSLDLRRSSSTFGKYEAIELSSDKNMGLLIGYGIGHAFLALEDKTRVSYLCDSVFEPELEYGINPLDSDIDWEGLARPFGIEEFIISDKDKRAPGLENAIDLLFD